MSPYTPLFLTHANLGKAVRIIIGTMAGYHYSDSTQSTHVYTTGGVFPVLESVEEIDDMLKRLNTSNKGEANVGSTGTATARNTGKRKARS